MKFSLFNADHDSATLSDLYIFITSSDNEQVLRVQQDPSILRREISKLPAFTPAGIFNKIRRKSSLSEFSQVVAMEYFALDQVDVNTLFNLAKSDKHVLLCYRNISQDGIIILVKTTADSHGYDQAICSVATYFDKIFQCNRNLSLNGLTDICLLSNDTDAYFSQESVPLDFDDSTDKMIENKVDNLDLDDPINTLSQIDVMDFLFQNTFSTHFSDRVFRAMLYSNLDRGKALGLTQVSLLNYLSYIILNFDESTESKVLANWMQTTPAQIFKSLADLIAYEQKQLELDSFSDEIYLNLPPFLQKATLPISDKRQKDVLLLGLISALSGLPNKMEGLYHGRKYKPNLFSFIIAPPASGKGILKYVNVVLEYEHKKMLASSRPVSQDVDLTVESVTTGNGNVKVKTILLPSNITHTRLLSLLHNNNGTGILLDSEADTLAAAFSSEHGDYSITLRKSFENEHLSIARVKDNVYLEINEPCMSVCISGTPNQVSGVIRSIHDGLFSRFLIYNYIPQSEWKNPNDSNSVNLDSYYNAIQEDLDYIQRNSSIELIFFLSDIQWGRLNDFFKQKMDNLKSAGLTNLDAIVKRHGLMAYKMLMLFGYLRQSDLSEHNNIYEQIREKKPQNFGCTDEDVNTVLHIVNISLENAISLANSLDETPYDKLRGNYKILFDSLPETFTRDDARSEGKKLNVSEKSVSNFLRQNEGILLTRLIQGVYTKII